jgi:predicted transcriptional regulator
MSKNVSISNVLKVLSDQKTQKLLRALIEAQEVQSQPLIVELGLSRRQYYNRIKDLVLAGLIRRQRRKYMLSSFGKVIISIQKIVEKAANSYWKMEAIDTIRMSDNSNLAEVDYTRIIDILLDDVEIKDIYLHSDTNSNKRKPHTNEGKREMMLNTLG